MKKILISTALGLALAVGATSLMSPLAGAVNVDPCTGTASSNSPLCQNSGMDENTIVKTIINIFLYLVGAISVIMIVYSGFRYVTSAGNQNSVTSAKNTLLYAVVGLVVAMFAWAIVNWVYNSVTGTP